MRGIKAYILPTIAILALGYIWLIQIKDYITHVDDYHWDFKIYYYASEALKDGVNPYDNESLDKYSKGATLRMPYLYNPLFLYIFRFFNLFKLDTAIFIYLFLKFVALIILYFLWLRIYNSEFSLTHAAILFAIMTFSFNTALLGDIGTGNISTFLYLFVWIAIYFLINQKFFLFATIISLVALIKLSPIIFLLVLLLDNTTKSKRAFFGGILVFAALMITSFVVWPQYLKALQEIPFHFAGGGGIYKPTLRVMLREFNLFRFFRISDIIYLFASGVMIYITVKTIRNKSKLKIFSKSNIENIMWLLTLYAIITLYFKCYDYILLVFPVFYFFTRYKNVPGELLFLFVILGTGVKFVPTIKEFYNIVVLQYYPLIIVIILWFAYYCKLKSHTRQCNIS